MQEAAALKVVREFRAVLARSRKAYVDMHPNATAFTNAPAWSLSLARLGAPSAYSEAENEINDSIHAVELIANEVDPKLANAIRARADNMWPYFPCDAACKELVRILSGRVKVARILARSGPLEAAGLHLWVWQAAESLWRDGHYPAAVERAASRILDEELADKLGVPRGASNIEAAFSDKSPTAGSPRLRFSHFPSGSKDWYNAHQGAMHFGAGCEKAIRNLVTHGGRKPDPQVALEMLAALSVLARWIDEAEVVTAEGSTVDALSEASS